MQMDIEHDLKSAHEIIDELAIAVRSQKPVRISIAEADQSSPDNSNWLLSENALNWDSSARLKLVLIRLKKQHPIINWDDVPWPPSGKRRINLWCCL